MTPDHDLPSQPDAISDLLSVTGFRVERVGIGPQDVATVLTKRDREGNIRVQWLGSGLEVVWSFAMPGNHPFFENLPEEAPTVDQNLAHMLASELTNPRPGGALLQARLAEALFVTWLRTLAVTNPSWVSPLRDPLILLAIRAIHSHPEHPWTAGRLSVHCGTSRSVLYRRFQSAVGCAPLSYLRRWRMMLARRRLMASDVPLEVLAAELGYSSAAAFSRAFKDEVGQPPTHWRLESNAS